MGTVEIQEAEDQREILVSWDSKERKDQEVQRVLEDYLDTWENKETLDQKENLDHSDQ